MIRFIPILLFVPSLAFAGDLTHQWKSPAFSGQGYSAHVLTIENQEFSRKQAIKRETRSRGTSSNTRCCKYEPI